MLVQFVLDQNCPKDLTCPIQMCITPSVRLNPRSVGPKSRLLHTYLRALKKIYEIDSTIYCAVRMYVDRVHPILYKNIRVCTLPDWLLLTIN